MGISTFARTEPCPSCSFVSWNLEALDLFRATEQLHTLEVFRIRLTASQACQTGPISTRFQTLEMIPRVKSIFRISRKHETILESDFHSHPTLSTWTSMSKFGIYLWNYTGTEQYLKPSGSLRKLAPCLTDFWKTSTVRAHSQWA